MNKDQKLPLRKSVILEAIERLEQISAFEANRDTGRESIDWVVDLLQTELDEAVAHSEFISKLLSYQEPSKAISRNLEPFDYPYKHFKITLNPGPTTGLTEPPKDQEP